MALDALWGFFSFMGRVRKEFSEVAGCSVLERATGRFQNAPCSATMADYLVLKPVSPVDDNTSVQQPWQITWY